MCLKVLGMIELNLGTYTSFTVSLSILTFFERDLPAVICYVHRKSSLRFIKTAELSNNLNYTAPMFTRSKSFLTMK